MPQKALTLYELNSLVREVIESTFDHAYWVEAELSEAREVRGHCYMELIQKDLFSPIWLENNGCSGTNEQFVIKSPMACSYAP